MNIKRNILANYLGQGYVIVIGVVTLPLYLKYLGAEAYGLIGFFSMLQALSGLFDLGMSPTLAREVVRNRAGKLENAELCALIRLFEIIFLVMGGGIWLIIACNSHIIAQRWLNVERLDIAEVAYCVILMGGMIGVRWLAGLYRGGVLGMERQIWLNCANIVVASIRYLGVLVVLIWGSREPRRFFEYQFATAVFELALFGFKFHSMLPQKVYTVASFSNSFRRIFNFAGSSAYVTFIWVLLTQFDKLILSKVLSLRDYGYFATAVVIAGVIQAMAGPINTALLPRMTYLFSQGKEDEMRLLYSKSTQITLVITAACSGVLAVFAKPLLYVWTNDTHTAASVAPILVWYALGNCILSINAFQYYLQYAHGQLRMHITYNTVFAAISVPSISWASVHYGAVGAGVTWFSLCLITFAAWPAIVHRKLLPGFHRGWVTNDIIPIVVANAALLALFSIIGIPFEQFNRLQAFLAVSAIGLASLTLNMLVSSACRRIVRNGVMSFLG